MDALTKQIVDSTVALEKYCREDAAATRRLCASFYPKPLTIWQCIWVILKGLVMNGFGRETYLRFLKCDSKGCPHMEFHAEITKMHVGKPCPRCGTNLLTPTDYENMEVK